MQRERFERDGFTWERCTHYGHVIEYPVTGRCCSTCRKKGFNTLYCFTCKTEGHPLPRWEPKPGCEGEANRIPVRHADNVAEHAKEKTA